MTAAVDRLTADAGTILRAAVAAADPAEAVTQAVRRHAYLRAAPAVHVAAVGKAAIAMAHAALVALDRPPQSCIIVAPRSTPGIVGPTLDTAAAAPAGDALTGCATLYAAHPVPDSTSVHAGRALAALLRDAGADDVVLLLLSGGASSLAVRPAGDIDISEYAACVAALLRAGAAIHEVNAVRRRIDLLKGGGMAALAAPARVVGLLLSDVVDDDVSVIASGPLSPVLPDEPDARVVLESFGLWQECAPAIRAVIDDSRRAPATRPGDVAIEIVGSNRTALDGAAERAMQLGYRVVRVPEPVTGEARRAGAALVRQAASLHARDTAPLCLLAGGETIVRVRGDGKGGRNQELVLAGAIELSRDPGRAAVIASLGTDGVDGPTDAAGAVAHSGTIDEGARLGCDAQRMLDANDSYTFFGRAGGLIRTGPTGTNVMDVQVVLVGGH